MHKFAGRDPFLGCESGTRVRQQEAIPGPTIGDVNLSFAVVSLHKNNFQTYEELRAQARTPGAVEPALIIYDVSPAGSAQGLIDDLCRYSNIIVLDHHGGAAPACEARGKELTAAEVAVEGLTKLWTAGALTAQDGSPIQIIAATHSLNVDPDSVITGFLIESFMDPTLRDIGWSEGNKDLLIRAARFGDVSLFGGIDIPNLNPETMSDEMKVAFAILDLINVQKERLVIDTKLGEVATELNLRAVADQWYEKHQGTFTNVEHARKEVEEAILSEIARAPALMSVGPEGETMRRLRDAFLRRELGEEFFTEDSLRSMNPHLLSGKVFGTLSRSQVREVFIGKDKSDLFSSKHAPYWNESSINDLLAKIRAELPCVLSNLDDYRPNYWRFAKGLQDVHELASHCSEVSGQLRYPERRITLSKPHGRIDREEEKPQNRQRFPIYDWLREASAAYGDPVIHVMNRGGVMTIAGRAPQPGEDAPVVTLNHPEFVADLKMLEASKAELKGRPPAQFLIKANLVLPYGEHNITLGEVTTLIFAHYNNIVAPYNKAFMPVDPVPQMVDFGDGMERPFDGTHHFLRARGFSVES